MNDGIDVAESELARWRQRAAELARQLDAAAAEREAGEALLRRLVQRLCLAARGLGDALDATLDRIVAAMRQPLAAAELEGLLGALSNALASADTPAVLAAQRHDTPAGPALRAALSQLIERIEFDESLQPRVAELQLRLAADADMAVVVEACAAARELVDAQREHARMEQADVQRILLQVDTRLHEFVNYLRGEQADRQLAEQSRQQLDDGLLGEVRELTASVHNATELAQLRQQVGRQLEAVDRHLQAFRARETGRAAQYRHRAERMRVRVEQLEHESRALQASLQREQVNASTDFLTGIPNRLALEQRVALEYARWKRFGRPLSIAVWDIDRFKAINDQHGHRAGDRVIRAVGRLLASQVRETDFVARYGGEEFVAVLVDAGGEQATLAVDKLRRAIEALQVDVDGRLLQVTASCGVAEFSRDDAPEAVFDRADRALLAAKQAGRNRCIRG